MNRLDDFIDRTQTLSSPTKLKDIFIKAVEDEGYQNAVFARARNQRIVSIPWNRFPQGYSDSYQREAWDSVDPVMQRLQTASRPFFWSDLATGATTTPRQITFLEECRELGVHSGLTMPFRDACLNVDVISLSLRDAKKGPPNRLPYLYAIATQYWLKFGALSCEKIIDPAYLTRKELECLRWCKEGKTNWEIGEIMLISEKTVEFHITNTIRKLGASNRITAVVMGIQRGLIAL